MGESELGEGERGNRLGDQGRSQQGNVLGACNLVSWKTKGSLRCVPVVTLGL